MNKLEVRSIVLTILIPLILRIPPLSVVGVLSQSVVGEEGLNVEQEEALNQLRPLALKILEQEHMKRDGYLLRWLSVNQFDVDKTLSALRETVAWRKQFGIEKILLEDFSILEKEIPLIVDGSMDNDGRPVLVNAYGLFDVRRIGLAGLTQKYFRFLIRNVELTELINFEHYKMKSKKILNNSTNKQLAQTFFITDLSGFSLKQGACFRCFSSTAELLTIFNANYPDVGFRVYLINSPKIFQPMLNLFKSTFATIKKEAWKVYGYDKNEWAQALLEEIPADQLLVEYGGTRRLISTAGELLHMADGQDTATAVARLNRNSWATKTNEFIEQYLASVQAREDSENLVVGFKYPSLEEMRLANSTASAGAGTISHDPTNDLAESTLSEGTTVHQHHHHFKLVQKSSTNFQTDLNAISSDASSSSSGTEISSTGGRTSTVSLVNSNPAVSSSRNNLYILLLPILQFYTLLTFISNN